MRGSDNYPLPLPSGYASFNNTDDGTKTWLEFNNNITLDEPAYFSVDGWWQSTSNGSKAGEKLGLFEFENIEIRNSIGAWYQPHEKELHYRYGQKISIIPFDLSEWTHLFITISANKEDKDGNDTGSAHTIYANTERKFQVRYDFRYNYFDGLGLRDYIGTVYEFSNQTFYPFKGAIRDFRVWNRSVNQATITPAMITTQFPASNPFLLLQWDWSYSNKSYLPVTVGDTSRKLTIKGYVLVFPLAGDTLNLVQENVPFPIITMANLKEYIDAINTETDNTQSLQLENQATRIIDLEKTVELQTQAIRQLQDFTSYLMSTNSDLRATHTIEYNKPAVVRVSNYGYKVVWGDNRKLFGIEIIQVDSNGGFIKTIFAD
jgi:hypothetical protein